MSMASVFDQQRYCDRTCKALLAGNKKVTSGWLQTC